MKTRLAISTVLLPLLHLASAMAAFAGVRALTPQSADADGTKKWWTERHERCLVAATNTPHDIVYLGDSITHNWRNPPGILNLGFGGDRTEHALWRITEGRELDGFQAKFVSVLIGSNNTGHFSETEEPPTNTILGIRKIVQTVLEKQTNAIVVLNALFPRGTNAADACRTRNDIVNREIRKFADGRRVFWCDITDRFIDPDGTLPQRLFPDALHPSDEGYGIWQEELQPFVAYALSDRTGPAPKERVSDCRRGVMNGMSLPLAFLTGWSFVRDGGKPEIVDLPHDGAIGYDFDLTAADGGCGGLPYFGHGEYRKSFVLAADDMIGSLRLEFDGVMSHAAVFVNGEKAAERANGYASFVVPLDGRVREGANEVRVTVDPSKDSSRWYPGFGIYRDVRLVRAPRDHVVPGSVAVSVARLTDDEAELKIDYEMSVGGRKSEARRIGRPVLWSPENPHLYTLAVGDLKVRYGIRTLRFDPKDGFFLNGVRRQMKGVCLHHDLGVFGAAFVKEAARRQLRLLKDMGCDAIRTSHNFPAPALLDLCDEMGLMVMDEAFDEWKRPKVRNGTAARWEEDHVRDLVEFVRRDRNHPCVVMWSAGNELPEDEPSLGLTESGVSIARELTAIFHANDPEGRPVTAGHWKGCTTTNGIGAATDVFGANYLPKFYASYRGRQGVIGTETCSTVSTRGTFFFPEDERGKTSVTNRVSDYGLVPMHGNDYPPDVEFAAQEANPHVYGEFVWTGFDYLGEPDPWRKTSRSSYFGIFDLCGFPKSRYWLYRSQWRPDVPTAHIVPHWNWRNGMRIPVHVFTSGDEAELFVNGKSQGRRRKGTGTYRLVWQDVPYEAGVLSVRTWKAGRPWAEDRRVTAGPFCRFVFTDEICGDYLLRSALAVDAQGNPVPDAERDVPYETPSGYDYFGWCNGDPGDLRSLRSPKVRSFSGRALIVFKRK